MEFSSPDMIKKLLSWLPAEKSVDIRFELGETDGWAVISLYEYEPDREISLRLLPDDSYELFYGYYDANDEFVEATRILGQDEAAMLPSALKKIMKKVLADEEGMRTPGKLLAL